MESLTRKLSDFLADLTYENIPGAVADKAKFVLLDTLGAMLAGSQSAEGRIARQLSRKVCGKVESTLIASGRKVDCLYAALFNGIMAHALELDDGNRYAMGHPGVSVIPTVIALGEKEKISGKQAIAAIVAGYETFGRIAAAGNPSHYNRGFHTTGTCGVFGAAAAAGKIFGFDTADMIRTLGIAGSQSAGLFAFMSNGAMTKVLHAGKAAHSGILSGLLVQEGFTGPDSVLEHSQGFYAAYTDRFAPERIIDGLGETYEILNTYTKYHAACRHVHPAVDAVLFITRQNRIDPVDIATINVRTYQVAARLTAGKEISTPLSGKMSLPYCVAAAAVDGQVGLKQFAEARLSDTTLLDVMNKVDLQPDEKYEGLIPRHRSARVEIVLKTGQRYEKEITDAVGEPENPGSLEDLLAKFKDSAAGVLRKKKMDLLIDAAQRLEKIENLNQLTSFL